MNHGIVIQSTGYFYNNMAKKLITSLDWFLPDEKKTLFIFTDRPHIWPLKTYKIPEFFDLRTSKTRYEMFESLRSILMDQDFLWYIDADMEVKKIIQKDIIPTGNKVLTAVVHPFVIMQEGHMLHPKSVLYDQSIAKLRPFWQACFWGGVTSEIFKMVDNILPAMRTDWANQVLINDEPYFNQYWVRRSGEVKTLPYIYNVATTNRNTHLDFPWPNGHWNHTKLQDALIIHHNAASNFHIFHHKLL